MEVCFVKAILRNRAVGVSGSFFLIERELEQFKVAQISSKSPLRLVDLQGKNLARMRIPTDTIRGRDHTSGMEYSLAFYTHPDSPDGLMYSSRINEMTNVVLYDRAVQKLRCDTVVKLLQCADLSDILDDYKLILIA